MVLSGYLFAKILDGRQVLYKQFLWDRVLGLAPLLIFVIAIIGIKEFAPGRDIIIFGQTMEIQPHTGSPGRCYLKNYLVPRAWTNSYWTIIGRVDQFILGIMAFQFRKVICRRHFIAILVLFLFALFYRYFDSLGGFYMNPSYPSPSPIWIYMPFIEGLAYAMLIGWYDNSFSHSTGKLSRFIALIGTASYSIYLIHFFYCF